MENNGREISVRAVSFNHAEGMPEELITIKIAHDSMCRNESSVIAEDLSKTKEAI